MLPNNLTAVEILDAGIRSETLAYKMYDRLSKRVDVPTLQARLTQLKKDEKDHRKTLRAHRRSLYGNTEMTVTESDALDIFGNVDVAQIRDKDSLIQTLYAAIKYEEYCAYFYQRQAHNIPNREARIFLEVLSSEGEFHSGIIKRQIDLIRPMRLQLDERGRTVEVVV